MSDFHHGLLRLPYNESELGLPVDEPGDATDVFGLLEDDLLITRLGLKTDRLLGPLHVNGWPEKPTDVELHLRVLVRVNVGMWANLDFV